MWSAIKSDLFEFVNVVSHDTTKAVTKVLGDENEDEKEEELSVIDKKMGDLRRSFLTYSTCIEEENRKSFDSWHRSFSLTSKAAEIAQVLDQEMDVSRFYADLVPINITADEFWARYFFRLEMLQKGGVLTFDEEDDEELAWECTEAPGGGSCHENDSNKLPSNTHSQTIRNENIAEENIPIKAMSVIDTQSRTTHTLSVAPPSLTLDSQASSENPIIDAPTHSHTHNDTDTDTQSIISSLSVENTQLKATITSLTMSLNEKKRELQRTCQELEEAKKYILTLQQSVSTPPLHTINNTISTTTSPPSPPPSPPSSPLIIRASQDTAIPTSTLDSSSLTPLTPLTPPSTPIDNNNNNNNNAESLSSSVIPNPPAPDLPSPTFTSPKPKKKINSKPKSKLTSSTTKPTNTPKTSNTATTNTPTTPVHTTNTVQSPLFESVASPSIPLTPVTISTNSITPSVHISDNNRHSSDNNNNNELKDKMIETTEELEKADESKEKPLHDLNEEEEENEEGWETSWS
eukprot:CAMPEP_0182423648 /NCGR_PEP_ID=MMETSP1167-20130531/9718_1 /TAXON_ID=2988 /ORGANISM="Mallomonas Sp, Strain CCMP3275" /LENGTH=517 /DNA_ID=CAMNT_0024602825 /DNA_START=34 /DNA_END=1587 /DNA_ORIENTATION=+